MFVSFKPVGSDQAGWAMEKLGAWVDPLDVVDGASKGLHAATGVKATWTDRALLLDTPDAALVRWDTLLPFPTPLYRQPDLAHGVSMLLFNNVSPPLALGTSIVMTLSVADLEHQLSILDTF